MNTIKITTSQNIELDYDLASLGERIVGYLIDILIIIAYFIALFLVLTNTSFPGRQQWIVWIFYIPAFFYDLASEIFMNGQSVGKKVMNIKVISLDGGQPTLGQYIIRWLFRLVDFSFTGYLGGLLSVAVSENKQRIGDMVAGTVLIKTVPRTNFQQTIYTPVFQHDYQVSFPEVTILKDSDMQLIKEVINNVSVSGNLRIAVQASEKIMQTLHIQSNMEPVTFLKVLLSDYNYLTSQGEE